MPYVELLAPPLPPEARAAVARAVTGAICDAFSVGPQTVTIYFIDIDAAHYAHAGEVAPAGPRRLWLKLHAYRRDVGARRAAAGALVAPLAALYALPEKDVAVYFFDRARDEVAHGPRLACDAEA